ncbi:DsbA family protein (plasmid) [Embleya sp. NBC_00888]|uniref:DsbA family protein n=1 Tax=Embleya sp. NBC_00888 TaxID=2975960 RepID=UPI002F91BE1B|nr:DsbA family protein [Embleya sp. NBC_00888]
MDAVDLANPGVLGDGDGAPGRAGPPTTFPAPAHAPSCSSRTGRRRAADAHRLAYLAAEHNLADPVMESLFHAYHTDGRNITDPEVLAYLGTTAGLPGSDVRRLLHGDAYTREVRADEARATALGIAGVRSVVIDGRPRPRASNLRLVRALLEDAMSATRVEAAD